MRNHFLRASGSENAESSGGSFERGFFGGSSTSRPYALQETGDYSYTTGHFLGKSHSSDPTIDEDLTWTLYKEYNYQSFFNSYYRAHKRHDVVLAEELTDAGVPSGAKFNKLSQYIWGSIAPTGKIPRGVRWQMFHTTDTGIYTNFTPKSGETATLLYQDTTTTEFPPLTSLDSDKNNATDGDVGNLVEISAGGGNDTGVSPSSYFEWNGTDDVVIEIATTQTSSGYQSYSANVFVKFREFMTGGQYHSDSDASAYDNDADSTSYEVYPYFVKTSGIYNYNTWTTLSNWSVNTSNNSHSENRTIQSLKLDYTT